MAKLHYGTTMQCKVLISRMRQLMLCDPEMKGHKNDMKMANKQDVPEAQLKTKMHGKLHTHLQSQQKETRNIPYLRSDCLMNSCDAIN